MRSRAFLPVFVAAGVVWLTAAALGQTIVVRPYVQPGSVKAGSGLDARSLHWFTDETPGDFVVEYSLSKTEWRGVPASRLPLDFAAAKEIKEKTKKPASTEGDGDNTEQPKKDEKKEPRPPLPPEKEQHYFKYTAQLPDLPLNAEVRYRVKLKDQTIREATFRTNASADKAVRCVLVGDMAQGMSYQRGIAYQISKQQPEFLVALGDIVYPTGRINQYMAYYWGTYNNLDDADPKVGAPLMASVPFYPVLGNHDIGAKLSKVPDALAAYYFFTPPKNGPGEGSWVTPLDGDDAANAKFRAANKDTYPYVDVYSFDNGPAHFVVLNVNPKMNLADPTLRKWLIDDLRAAKDRWKIVCFHMPGFQSSIKHYAEQQARPLSPIFEEVGVSLTFAGHVHNYQRTMPLRFEPEDKPAKKGQVNGKFTLDKVFDGVKNTTPNGVIHIVAGGGGAGLYGPGFDETKPVIEKKFGANYADFTSRMVVDRHSFTVLDCAPERLQLRAVAANGDELDRIVITKK
jgi:hypothetical protein